MNGLDLPTKVVEVYERKGVRNLFPWQFAALSVVGNSGENFIYSAPTSGGKSLVAEILLIRSLTKVLTHARMHKQRNTRRNKPLALFVLPFLSIVREKAHHMTDILGAAGITVNHYADSEESKKHPLSLGGENVAFCSMEKANIAVNKLSAQGRLNDLVCVVVDELHMIGDPDRGITLELLLTKLVSFQCRNRAHNLQIIGMSATMGGMDALSKWLRASLFVTDFRPVSLEEFVVLNGCTVFAKVLKRPWEESGAIFESHKTLATCEDQESATDGKASKATSAFKFQRTLKFSAPKEIKDSNSNSLIFLVAEGLAKKDSILIFCPSRRNCEITVAMIVQQLSHQLYNQPFSAVKSDREALIIEIEAASGVLVSERLRESLLAGIAYHHAGLMAEERRVIEQGYRKGVIHTLAATTTLAAGVNLPATRVIIKQSIESKEVSFQGRPVERMQYMQMAGRAGRIGQASKGEVYVLANGSEKALTPAQQLEVSYTTMTRLLTSPLPVIASTMLAQVEEPGGAPQLRSSAVQRLFLEAIVSGMVCKTSEAMALLGCSLAAQQLTPLSLMSSALSNAANEALHTLSSEMHVLTKYEIDASSEWRPSARGRAIYDSALPLALAIIMERELDIVAQTGVGLSFEGPWQLVFVVLPVVQEFGYSVCDWPRWHSMLAALSPEKRHVASLMGATLESAWDVRLGKQLTNKEEVLDRHGRCAVALMIEHAVVGLEGLDGVIEYWGKPGFLSHKGITRGQLQKLMEEVSKLMSMARMMCDSKGWWPLGSLFGEWARSVATGVRQELVPLMQIDGMTAARARALFKGGYGSIESLARADQGTVATILRDNGNKNSQRGPAKTHSSRAHAFTCNGNAVDAISRRSAQVIINGAKRISAETESLNEV